jgi:hypothetical protein
MMIDDLMIYNRVLTGKEIRGLYMLANRIYDFADDLTTGIEQIENEPASNSSLQGRAYVYDLYGRIVTHTNSSESFPTLPKGIYIINGRKFVVK